MEAWIQCDGESKGKISYPALLIYKLLSEHLGFHTEWDYKEKKLYLFSSLHEKKIYMSSLEKNDNVHALADDIKTFFIGTGVELEQVTDQSSLPKDGEVILKMRRNPKSFIEDPCFYILYSSDPKGKFWAKNFYNELTKNRFETRIKQDPKKKSNVTTLELHYPFHKDKDRNKEFQEHIAFMIASALMRGLTKGTLPLLIPYLSVEMMELIFPIKSIDKQKMWLPESNEQEVQKKEHENYSNTTEANSLKARYQLEVYLDYSVVVPNSDQDPYLVMGNLYMKNTGNEVLINPLICLKVSPTEDIQLKGQIVPPKMADTVGVQGFDGDGAVGWRYLDENWFEKAKNTGEYWICPIQTLQIQPGQTENFSNFQLSIPRWKEMKTFHLNGIVYFKNHRVQFPSNNQITLSF